MLRDAEIERNAVVYVENLLETAYNYIGQNKWIKSQLRFTLQRKNTPPLEDTPPPEDTLSTEGTLSTEDTPPEDTPPEDTPPEDTPSREGTLSREGTTSTEDTPSTDDTPSEDTPLAKEKRIADILHCDFEDYNTEQLIKSNSTIWSQNPSSFYKQDDKGVTKLGRQYDNLVQKIIRELETCIPKPSFKFINGLNKRACPSTSTASKPKSKRTRLSTSSAAKPKPKRSRPLTSSSLKPVIKHQRDITRTYNQRDTSKNGKALQYQRTDETGAGNDPNRDARLARMAMRNLVSNYPAPDSSSSNCAVNTGLSILPTDGLQFIENRKTNQAKATCDMISGRGNQCLRDTLHRTPGVRSSESTMSNQPNPMQQVATDQIARNLSVESLAVDPATTTHYDVVSMSQTGTRYNHAPTPRTCDLTSTEH
ncbi:hypothetical protein VE02_08924 [Pseudogymnoascus sp. 03VT05]|nr:hypothetical protein VE02_08924 [Pseudogymnoascus sp. 03VT05]